MKSPLAALSALAAATLALTGCGATQSSSSSTASASSSQAASGKVEVFAAASLNNAGADLEKAYEAANPGVDVTFVYEGSAKLVNQIEQGATPDLLITADTKNMDKAKKLDQFSASETNVLVTNKLVLVTAEGNPGKINSLDDLKTTDGVVAVCKEEVPCGTIAHQELKKHDITLKNATTESKVTDVATKVTTGNADAGFIYTTDLAAAPVNACRAAEGKPEMSLKELVEEELIRYVPFPDALKGKYQSFTQADITKLREAGYKEEFLDVKAGVERYVKWMLENLA